jgi:hypothetical protein
MYSIIVFTGGKYTAFFFTAREASLDDGLARITIAITPIKYFSSQTFS